MRKAVTINDIAKASGFSRNTVAKVLNGYHMSEKTVKIVMNKAIDMGYKGLNMAFGENGTGRTFNRILVTSTHPIMDIDFFTLVVKQIESEAFHHSYDIVQLMSHDQKILKNYINEKEIDGIACFETLEKESINNILSLEKPTAFVDFNPNLSDFHGRFDVIGIEGYRSVRSLIETLIKKTGVSSIGFIGDPTHCLGFSERYEAVISSSSAFGLPSPASYSLLPKDGYDYGKTFLLSESLRSLKKLPDLFVCANDYIASRVNKSLRLLGVKVPEKVQVIGFDDSYEAISSSPKITTIGGDKNDLGKAVFFSLTNQIQRKLSKNSLIEMMGEPIFRESTRYFK